MPLQPQAQAPARTATAGRAGGGIDVLGRVAGRPPLISRALHALSRRSRRRGCVVVIDLDPTLWPARFACYAAVSSVRPGHERRPTGQRPVAVPMPTSHPYKGSEAGAARVRTYMVLRCAPGLPSWSMFRRGSFSHMCLPFQFSISMCGALFPSCWGGRPGGYVAGWWLALYATMVYGWMGVSDCRCLPACLLASQPARARRRDERACMI